DPQAAYNSRAAAALGGMKSEEVKAWLAEGAFAAAGSDPAKCAAVARAAGELRLEGARKGLEKLVGHASNDVALAAILALTRVGVGEATAGIAQALERRKGKGDATFMIQALDALATSGTDEAVDVVAKFAGGSDAEARTIAMGSLALAPQSPKAVAALTKGLADDDPVVRLAALKGLGRHRDKAMVEPLIEFLGKEKEERLKANALEILVPLTNQNMGLVYEDWKKWWEANGDRFELPKGDGEKGTTQVKARDLSYFGIEVSSKRLSFLVDISSSMTQEMTVTRRTGKDDDPLEPSKGKTEVKGGRKGGGGGGGGGAPGGGEATKMKRIDVLKRELVRILKKLPADTQVNIITFNRTHKAWQDQLQPLAGGGRDKAVKFVEGLQTGTGTNVFDTVEAALKDKRVDTLYLLTDGEPTAGRITQPQAILEEVRNQNKGRRATIHCIGFGEDSAFLRDLARLNGGDYRFVNEY
ncbi:MAG: HEAT repeat domain-containing protein, partial [Planctomycetes bacterium]|nr:HEAT repeat domain-containing protein [Planctomycetota bacterium]